ncbi:MAG: 2OG-Fe(II) oxygenase [Saprospiraceae bacterium]|nr:2OG-Fe(II) oxygenase [Saprospiraceae bacterium]
MSTKTIAPALNAALINEDSITRYREEFATGRPYKHLVIDNFLEEGLAESLFANFPKVSELRKHYKGINENKSEGSSFDHYHTDFARVLDAIKSPAFIQWLEQVTQIDDLSLPDDHRGAGVHQGRNGSFLDIHVDFSVHPILNLHRRLNLLIYLNKNWKPEYGGLLELWNEDVSVLEKAVLPGFNRAVIFETTETSYHGYDVITIPRKRIAQIHLLLLLFARSLYRQIPRHHLQTPSHRFAGQKDADHHEGGAQKRHQANHEKPGIEIRLRKARIEIFFRLNFFDLFFCCNFATLFEKGVDRPIV